jgi:hypothetical protein
MKAPGNGLAIARAGGINGRNVDSMERRAGSGASRISCKSRGAVLESGRKGSRRATAATASGPLPPDWRRGDAGAAIGLTIASLQRQKNGNSGLKLNPTHILRALPHGAMSMKSNQFKFLVITLPPRPRNLATCRPPWRLAILQPGFGAIRVEPDGTAHHKTKALSSVRQGLSFIKSGEG